LRIKLWRKRNRCKISCRDRPVLCLRNNTYTFCLGECWIHCARIWATSRDWHPARIFMHFLSPYFSLSNAFCSQAVVSYFAFLLHSLLLKPSLHSHLRASLFPQNQFPTVREISFVSKPTITITEKRNESKPCLLYQSLMCNVHLSRI